MSDYEDVYLALRDGLAACESLDSWVTHPDACRIVRARKASIERGLKALEKLRNSKSDERYYSDQVDKVESCQCAICGMPPCSWCTDSANVVSGE